MRHERCCSSECKWCKHDLKRVAKPLWFGDAWKRYVDPSGDNAGSRYHGLIQLPGMPTIVRIGSVLNRPIDIPAFPGIESTPLVLGYEDDNYSDNGYYKHDDGTENQCRGV